MVRRNYGAGRVRAKPTSTRFSGFVPLIGAPSETLEKHVLSLCRVVLALALVTDCMAESQAIPHECGSSWPLAEDLTDSAHVLRTYLGQGGCRRPLLLALQETVTWFYIQIYSRQTISVRT
jgi:hypothetical protein